MKLLGYKVRQVVLSRCRMHILRRVIMIFALPITVSFSSTSYAQNEQDLESGSDILDSLAAESVTQDTSQSDANSSPQWSIGDDEVEEVELAEISDVPIVNLPRELSENLDNQFKNILKLEEELDAFDERLGESYLGYATTLGKAGRLEEARDMYAKVLHLSKINNGVYSLEQRPVLRAMFELHTVEGDIEGMEAALNQIIWIEKKHPKIQDRYSHDLVLKLGGAFIDLYYSRPRFDEISLSRVQKAITYMNYALRRYEIELSEEQQPFGDLAQLHYLRGQISQEIGRAGFYDPRRDDGRNDFGKQLRSSPRGTFFGVAARELERYLILAKLEKSIVHEVRALRDLGDLNLLFERPKSAAYYYKLSWEAAANLDENHELVKAFNQPNIVPNFDYRSDSLIAKIDARHVHVPVSLDLLSSGRVKKVYRVSDDEDESKVERRARRLARKLVFRPIIENGEMVATDRLDYDVKVRLRKDEYIVKSELDE